jgi:hypothetical protein
MYCNMSEDAKKALKNVNFQFKGAHVAYTSGDQGGAASGLNDAYLFKSVQEADLTDNQRTIIANAKEEYTPLQKQTGITNSLSSVKSDAGEDNLTKGNEMSDKEKDALQKALDKVANLEKQLQDVDTSKLTADIEKFKFSESEAVVKTLQGVNAEEREVLTKAFEDIFAAKEEITKTLDLKTEADSNHAEVGADGEAEFEKAVDADDINGQLKELNKQESK